MEALKELIFYIARDLSGALYLYTDKPIRGNYFWGVNDLLPNTNCMELDRTLYPEVTWDSEPLEVTLIKYES